MSESVIRPSLHHFALFLNQSGIIVDDCASIDDGGNNNPVNENSKNAKTIVCFTILISIYVTIKGIMDKS